MTRIPPTVWVTAERIFAQLFGLFVFAVQAPMLGPHAFGLVAVVMVFVGFWEAVPGFAAIDALLSIRDIEELHFGSVVIISAIFGLLLGAAVFGLAGPLAVALGDAKLAPVMRAMAALPLIQAFSIAPTAAAQRDLLFRSLAIRTIVSLIAGGIVGLGLALAGAGVWALVWQALVQRSVATVVLWVAVPTPLTSGMSRRHLRELSEFALPNMLSRIMSWASGQVPRLILGFFLGPTDLGIFTLATRLNDIVTQVAMVPKMLVARVDLRRFATNPDALGVAVNRVFLHMSVVAYPLCVGGAVVTQPLVIAWLDSRWHGGIVAAELLLLMGIPFVTIYASASLLLALNRQRWEAAICTAQSIATVLGVAVAAPFGVVAAAAAMVVVSLLTVPLTIVVMHRDCGVSLRNIILPQAPAFAASCLMGGAVFALRGPLETALSSRLALPIEILSGIIVYVVLIAFMMPTQMALGFEYVRQLLRKSVGAEAARREH